MSRTLDIEPFLTCISMQDVVLLDARSPSEFRHASIPGAHNLPLLTDDHRAQVGTEYKQRGKEAAIILGFKLAGPLFAQHIERALALAPHRRVVLYCWRGGMRSQILAWVLGVAGFEVTLLRGGYKSFRHWVLNLLSADLPPVKVLGGKTGAGKTELLEELKATGAQVIDLEHLANHRGSAFGALGLGDQPSQESFENALAWSLQGLIPGQSVWMENESRLIGKLKLPPKIYDTLRSSQVYEVDLPLAERMDRIWAEYGVFNQEDLVACTKKIESKLGTERCRQAIRALEQDDAHGWLQEILAYYDRQYQKASETRSPDSLHTFQFDRFEAKKIASVLTDAIRY